MYLRLSRSLLSDVEHACKEHNRQFNGTDSSNLKTSRNRKTAATRFLSVFFRDAIIELNTDVGDEATAQAIASLPSMLGGEKESKPAVPAMQGAGVDISGLGDAALKELRDAIAAETARRKG